MGCSRAVLYLVEACRCALLLRDHACHTVLPSVVGRQVPTVVIPVYERDLCKLKMTAQSITQHDKVGVLGKVIICWVSSHPLSDYGDQMEEVKRALEPHGEVEVIELAVNGEGWKVQQAAKLKVASRVYSDFYVVLDAKNTILRDLEEDTFFTSCNQAKIFGRYEVGGMPGVHRDWYYNSASVLEVDPMDYGKWPASITPMTMHTQTVKDMLDKIGEPQDFGDCSAGLCDAFGRDATEFTLYVTYVGRIANMWCIHDIEESGRLATRSPSPSGAQRMTPTGRTRSSKWRPSPSRTRRRTVSPSSSGRRRAP
ncbi:unnamed protein product [Prorocentrum cordatum]|uniref:Hexosyltransferase n=1 Tax=Prorocentrum cordatum TaxID=2364126 RepID=A0ABN9WL42_9DINO|nr:unnamed protein product [Polarella glacialis]